MVEIQFMVAAGLTCLDPFPRGDSLSPGKGGRVKRHIFIALA